jgi:hypothetical protein
LAEWLVEQGIGEERALLVDGGEAVAARVHWPGGLAAGQVEDAVLTHFDPARRRGTARFASGEEALAAKLPAGSREGAAVRLEVTRAAMAERGRLKRAHARPTDAAPRAAPSLLEALPEARPGRPFPAGQWEDLWAQARSGRCTSTAAKPWRHGCTGRADWRRDRSKTRS